MYVWNASVELYMCFCNCMTYSTFYSHLTNFGSMECNVTSHSADPVLFGDDEIFHTVTCSGIWRRRSNCYSGLFTTSLVVTTNSFYNVRSSFLTLCLWAVPLISSDRVLWCLLNCFDLPWSAYRSGLVWSLIFYSLADKKTSSWRVSFPVLATVAADFNNSICFL
jgi:hypothetical protein